MGLAPYCASKHALECIAESLQVELKPFNIQVQTINPGGFLTGFNETMAETAFHWQDDSRNFIKRADIQKLFDASIGHEEARLDPTEMINAMVSIVPARYRQVSKRRAKGGRGIPEDASEGSLGNPYLILTEDSSTTFSGKVNLDCRIFPLAAKRTQEKFATVLFFAFYRYTVICKQL